jgi:CRP/FNR family transcriptional regulator
MKPHMLKTGPAAAVAVPPDIAQVFPLLTGELGADVLRSAERRTISKGTVLYEQGTPCPLVPFILAGTVRVYKVGESGREITLYRVEAGQTCVLSCSCALSDVEGKLPAIAVAETDVSMLAVPSYQFRRLLKAHPALLQMINSVFTERLSEMMMVVEEVAFQRVDLRLAEWLLRATEPSAGASGASRERPAADHVSLTHAQLAVELGSAREVISRILKDFERRGFVHLGRGRVDLADRAGLRAYLASLKQGE